MMSCAEYLWLDGSKPTQVVRSKSRILPLKNKSKVTILDFPDWGFDGSSTYQASGNDSDLVLKPVNFVKDPLRGKGSYLVMCEVFDSAGMPHSTNIRAKLRELMKMGGEKLEPWMGFEQEYTLFKNSRPYGWPENGFPLPQGPFYCGVGHSRVVGRDFIDQHTNACLDAGIMIFGTNAEVMLGQWEFQIGYRGVEGEKPDPLNVSDHLWFARWLLFRLGEECKLVVSLENKPVPGDWNGAGAHTNFSTNEMRDPKTGWSAIGNFVDALSLEHDSHIAVYGHGLSERLTGLHETCDIGTFRAGERDRGASIRIPQTVCAKKYGYIEDRRPGANCDPYQVSARLLETLLAARKTKKAGASRQDSLEVSAI